MATVDRFRNGDTPPSSESSLWTAHEVADLLGVSHEYVWQLSREGRIPTVSLGRARRYRRESILAWLERIESPGGQT
jgi:excisionase family DNA binding protein